MTKVHGCTIEALSDAAALIAEVRGMESLVAQSDGTDWLLAHCDDGVIWGKWDSGQQRWRLSHELFPHISPALTADNLQQLRLFGAVKEVLIWRGDDGFCGRVVEDSQESFDKEHPLRPETERHILIGDRLLKGPIDGFSLVGDARGSRHAVPVECKDSDFYDSVKKDRLRWPLSLRVKHYFEQDERTGVVRIALSRLVCVQ